MRIVQVPTLIDNYTYLIISEATGRAIIVDSPDAEATVEALKREQATPIAIFSTHHHLDHVGANFELVQEFGIPVYGSLADDTRIPELTHPLKERDVIALEDLRFRILEIPGHTNGHIAFVGTDVVFCGDTLFAGGCGRLFEGTPAEMVDSLKKLRSLPDETKVYCGHEYTQKNLEFALSIDTNNWDLHKKYGEVLTKRQAGQSTVPSTIGEEKSYNPFLRWDNPEFIKNLKKKIPDLPDDPVSIFAATRALKDRA